MKLSQVKPVFKYERYKHISQSPIQLNNKQSWMRRSQSRRIFLISNSPYIWMTTCSILNFVICGIAFYFLGKLLLYHINLHACGLTTFEHMFSKIIDNKDRKKGLSYFKDRIQSHGKYWWLCLFIPSFISPNDAKRA